ncbi:hexosaminidase [Pseudarcicella hirudinis]|uniref:beta-N-acetylhexosaminidase n=2 Tax=Pseudarcicella hirudinis TaxID=1079859 RepID=A0A1I5XD71_9BACT|nr:hexosaminidase [Pseudarcicella hirudinis]
MLAYGTFAQHSQNTVFPIIPRPASLVPSDEHFQLNKSTAIFVSRQSLQPSADLLKQAISHLGHFAVLSSENKKENVISLETDATEVPEKEGYFLRISQNKVEITGHDEAGVFYGIQSLIQLLYLNQSSSAGLQLPGCAVKDSPRFSYRGLHLDVGRNFFPVSFIRKYIDLLSFYKFNTFHWHLTEDQGWRIEIKKYPELQSVSAFRDETIIGHKKDSPHRFDGKKYGGFYTQQEVKEVVEYARSKYVTIIPEIEMPGHAMAALAAYPNLGCTGGPYKTATFWGVFDDVFCAGNDSTFHFLEDVLSEVLALFPSKYIHIGGDECPKTQWKICPKCQKRMKDEHLKDEHELQSYFIRRMEKYLNSKQREIIGWDEILEGGLSPKATVMSWRGEEGGIAAAQQKHDVIMSPESHLYLDYYQSLNPNEPIAAGGFTPLKKVYDYDPVPGELKPEEYQYIKGIQANIWSEYLYNQAQVEYMVFPRAIAVSETGWSAKTHKNYEDFLKRLRLHKIILRDKKVNFFDRFEELNFSFTTHNDGKVSVHLSSTLPQANIRYTTNGKNPGMNDKVFKNDFFVEKSTIFKAQLFGGTKPYGKVFEQSFDFHKAIGKSLTLKNKPKGNFNPKDPLALVNGITGSLRYNDGQWSGFSGENFEAVIDLGIVQNIQKLGLNILKYHWQRMWEPNVLVFYLSENGKDYKEVYRQKTFPENAVNKVRASVPLTKARFIKIEAENKGIIPKGEYGAGNKAWLMIDEIYVN